MDSDPLFQCPGFEQDSGKRFVIFRYFLVDEPFKYGRLAVKSVASMHNLFEYWKLDAESELPNVQRELLHATAMSTLFCWINAQAHCLGNHFRGAHPQTLIWIVTIAGCLSPYHKLFRLYTIQRPGGTVDVAANPNGRKELSFCHRSSSFYQYNSQIGWCRNEYVLFWSIKFLFRQRLFRRWAA